MELKSESGQPTDNCLYCRNDMKALTPRVPKLHRNVYKAKKNTDLGDRTIRNADPPPHSQIPHLHKLTNQLIVLTLPQLTLSSLWWWSRLGALRFERCQLMDENRRITIEVISWCNRPLIFLDVDVQQVTPHTFGLKTESTATRTHWSAREQTQSPWTYTRQVTPQIVGLKFIVLRHRLNG